jgi:hypothetical protein
MFAMPVPTKRFLAVLAIAAIASVLYATSATGAQPAGHPRSHQLVALQRKVRAMQREVLALRETTTLLRREFDWTLEMIETATRDSETCFAALTSDAFQSTWSQIDSLAATLGAPPVFGSQTAVDDKNSCQGLGMKRAPLNPSLPPTVAPFQAFIGWWLNGG